MLMLLLFFGIVVFFELIFIVLKFLRSYVLSMARIVFGNVVLNNKVWWLLFLLGSVL